MAYYSEDDFGGYDHGNDSGYDSFDDIPEHNEDLDVCPSEATCCLHGGYCGSNPSNCCKCAPLLRDDDDHIPATLNDAKAEEDSVDDIAHLMETYSVGEDCARAIAFALTQSWGTDEIIDLFVKVSREVKDFDWSCVTNGTWEHELILHGIE